jgi:cyclohexyl-isocyanide hydratase
MSTSPFHVVFAIYPDMTHLDFTGPHQFLSRMPGSRTTVASLFGGAVRAEGGLVIGETERLAEVPSCDLICVPGGMSATAVALDEAFLDQIRRLAGSARYITSVCTGSLILGAAGLLQGKRAACHWGWHELLPLFGALPDTARVVRDGNIITGGGVTAGIDFALTVIAEVKGTEVAETMQLGFEYAPAPPFQSGHPSIARPEILARCRAGFEKNAARRRLEAEQAASRMPR